MEQAETSLILFLAVFAIIALICSFFDSGNFGDDLYN